MPSERQLAESFGVGRFVVREALKSLGLLGLLEVRQGDGTYVRSPDSSLLPRVVECGLLVGEQRTSDLVETRQHLEPVTARLAAERRTESELQTILSHLNGMRDATDTDRFVDADVALHLSIAQATKNSVLSNMLSSISSLLNVWIRNVVNAAPCTEPSHLEHVPIYEAIEARNADAAGEAMRHGRRVQAQRRHRRAHRCRGGLTGVRLWTCRSPVASARFSALAPGSRSRALTPTGY